MRYNYRRRMSELSLGLVQSERDSIRDEELSSLGYEVKRIDTKEHIENRLKEILSVA